MTGFLGNLWANIQIMYSNYVYYFGGITNLVLVVLVVAAIVVGLVGMRKLPRLGKKRGQIEYISANAEDVEHASYILSRAIKLPTITGQRGEMDKLLVFLKQRYQDVFKRLNAIEMPSGSLLLCWKSANRDSGLDPVLICGHMDVVPPNGQWRHDPFSGHDDGANVWGRGALDYKGVLISCLEALDKTVAQGHTPQRDIYFAFSTDGESGGYEGTAQMADFFRKRGIKLDFVLDQGGYVNTAYRGDKTFPACVVAVGEKGSVNIKLTAVGKGGHSSLYKKHTTVGVLAEAICRVENAHMHRRLLPEVKEFLFYSSPSFNGWQKFLVANQRMLRPLFYRAFRNDSDINGMFRTTFAVTQVAGASAYNVMPERATAVIDARILQGDTIADVERHIKSIVADLPINVEVQGSFEPSKITSTNSHQFDMLRKAIEQHFGGITVIPAISPIATDARHYADIAQNIFRFSPIMVTEKQRQTIHGIDEFISKEALGVAVEFYKTILSGL